NSDSESVLGAPADRTAADGDGAAAGPGRPGSSAAAMPLFTAPISSSAPNPVQTRASGRPGRGVGRFIVGPAPGRSGCTALRPGSGTYFESHTLNRRKPRCRRPLAGWVTHGELHLVAIRQPGRDRKLGAAGGIQRTERVAVAGYLARRR